MSAESIAALIGAAPTVLPLAITAIKYIRTHRKEIDVIETTWAIDCMEASLDLNLVPRDPPVIFPYKTGTTSNPDIEWTEADIARFPHSQIYRLHQGFGTQDAFRTPDGIAWDEADMEPRAWTVTGLLDVIQERNSANWSTRVYASDTPWSALLAEASARNISLHSVFWREANWSLTEDEARRRIGPMPGIGGRYAVQWASPTSNPQTPCPITGIPLRTCNLDLNVIGLRPTGWQR